MWARDLSARFDCPGTEIRAMLRGTFETRAVRVDPANLMHQVRTWLGDVCDLPAYQGPFHAAFFNAVFGNVADQRAALLAVALQLRPGGHLVISHPLGRAWVQVRCPDSGDLW